MKSVITSKGVNLLHMAPADGSPSYWIGYYGLAFVPSENRADVDAVSQSMTELTTTGDHIYNLWQGAMPCDGYAENSAAGDLYGLSMYTSNVLSRFRYVLDEDGNNNLVMWKGSSESNSTKMVGATVYKGISEDNEKSGMPVPAPLFYMGEPVEYSAKLNEAELKSKIMGNSSSDYDYPTTGNLPLVSTDTRNYNQSKAGMNGPETDTGFSDVGDLESVTGSKYEWTSASDTYTQMNDASGSNPISNPKNQHCEQFWKFQSISNYNRFHAPASSEGFQVDYEPSCRNMSKVTKYFPIAHYQVLNAKENASSMNSVNRLASALKFKLSINVADIISNTAIRAVEYADTNVSGIDSVDGTDMYVTKTSSFKFNRIGLYAVPMSVHKFYDQYNEGSNACQDYKVQFEINGDAEPVLFAVVDLDQTVTLREGEIDKFEYDIALNVTNDDDSAGSVIRDAGIFYNMYEDDAITWYKNQLIATASLSDAIVDQGIELSYLKQRINSASASECGASGGTLNGDAYALKNHTHSYSKNIVDSEGSQHGVRGIDTTTERQSVERSFYDYEPTGYEGTLVKTIPVTDEEGNRIYYVGTTF